MSFSSSGGLSSIGLFSNLRDDDRDLLSSYGEFLPVADAQVLIQEGQAQPYLYSVIAGELEVYRTSGEELFSVTKLFPGDSIGEMSMLDLSEASASVVARQFSQVWRISHEQFIQFIEDNPSSASAILLSIIAILSRRLRQVDPSAIRYSERAS